MASGLAAACSKTLLAPFDTIKTMQQQVVRESAIGEKALGFVEASKLIMRRPNGFMELYAGLGVSALGSVPSVGLYFGVYSYSKEKIESLLQKVLGHQDEWSYNDKGKKYALSESMIRTLSIVAAATIGNTVASCSRVPYEVVKQKLQTGQYSSTRSAITDMFSQQGVKAFFPMGGISIQMIRDIPYAIFTLLSYECLRDHWVTKQNLNSDGRPWKDMVAGGLAGGIGSFLTNPMDVIKTRIQTDSNGIYNGEVWRCTQATYAEGGPATFLRGSIPRLMHKIPANGFFFLFYELFRRILDVDNAVPVKNVSQKEN